MVCTSHALSLTLSLDRTCYTAFLERIIFALLYMVFQKKIAQSLSTTVCNRYNTIKLCRFQQNLQKENVYTTKASV